MTLDARPQNPPNAVAPFTGAPEPLYSGEEEVATRRGPLHAFRFRNFRLFFAGQLVSVAGSWMQAVAQQWLVFDLTHSAAWLGIVSGASAIPYVAFAMSGGRLADRHERRTILVWTQCVFMALAAALSVLATNRWIPVHPWHVAALGA